MVRYSRAPVALCSGLPECVCQAHFHRAGGYGLRRAAARLSASYLAKTITADYGRVSGGAPRCDYQLSPSLADFSRHHRDFRRNMNAPPEMRPYLNARLPVCGVALTRQRKRIRGAGSIHQRPPARVNLV